MRISKVRRRNAANRRIKPARITADGPKCRRPDSSGGLAGGTGGTGGTGGGSSRITENLSDWWANRADDERTFRGRPAVT
ncbi:hypothetical protein Asi02nite_59100 [Asanoa siamensis]|uniref:Uncharacterized protein n=1 Tax=Asanoa siamensis TaxID=926357 RepID=A0ABQ4CYN9_9ACTN|nr:hypothetical protein Asi02nite_59100 [Asanoa siamensis]